MMWEVGGNIAVVLACWMEMMPEGGGWELQLCSDREFDEVGRRYSDHPTVRERVV